MLGEEWAAAFRATGWNPEATGGQRGQPSGTSTRFDLPQPRPATTPSAAGVASQGDVEQQIRAIAAQRGFSDPDLLVATARQESGLNARAVGDQGNSRGPFQEHIRGRGAGLAPEQSFDVTGSTNRAIDEFTSIRQRFPEVDRGTWAARAQRPADAAGYASSINGMLGAKPAQPVRDDWTAPFRQLGWAPDGSPAPTTGGAGTVWPVGGEAAGQILNPFGGPQRRNAGATVSLPSSNVGVDLRGRPGDPVLAPVTGRIVEVHQAQRDDDPNEYHGWGGSVVVQAPDGIYYRLSHQRAGSIGVRVGDPVQAGQVVGQVGHSGNAGKDNDHLDVEKYTGSGPMANDRQYLDFAAGLGAAAGAVGRAFGTGAGRATATADDWVAAFRRVGWNPGA